ncbi:hypothetical protein GOP47_0029707 [Adiantum capillus-veneris]|nr:hypothetical protein GOP47_0029707 [Adiantum capillus-veneris]
MSVGKQQQQLTASTGVEHHVVVFPWPEQGHINPAMSLALHLAASGILVTFVHTQRTYASLLHSLDQQHSPIPNLRVEVVPDVDPLWSHPAATERALDLLLSSLMSCHPAPSCLLVDTFFGPWSHALAARHGLACVEIWIAAVCAFTIGIYIPELIARGFLPITDDPGSMQKVIDFIPGLPPLRMSDVPAVLATSDLDSPMFKFFASVVERSKDADRVLVHTVPEIESAAINALREKHGIRMDAYGPLVTTTRHGLFEEDPESISWLDKQEKGSVLYIAFGSVSIVKREDLEELAYGLAASGQPFLWVMRPSKDGKQADIKLQEALAVLKEKGKGYVTSWAPQLQVLGHAAVGAFLSHCGWNSINESFHVGVPILGFPQGGDQPINFRLIVHDRKAALPLLPEGEKSLQREHVEKAVKEMFNGDGGKRAKEGALEWSKLSHKALYGSSKSNLDKFVDDIKQRRLKISLECP